MRYLLLASVALVWSGPAFAQQAQVDQTETAPSEKTSSGTTADALSDVIIVTATKKGYGENLQNVPVAVTAFGEAQLDAKFVQNPIQKKFLSNLLLNKTYQNLIQTGRQTSDFIEKLILLNIIFY